MIKLVILCLCIHGALSSPLRSHYEILEDIENEAEVIDAVPQLKGTGNLHEKRLPVIRLTFPSGFRGLPGTRNLAEQPQIPYRFGAMILPGTENLEEKSIPLAGLRRNVRNPKSEVVSIY